MISPRDFFDCLKQQGIEYYTGVPDSLLKDFCAYVASVVPSSNNVIAANEGNAVALAAGYHLATGKIGLVYMQNSGLGNAVNPLLSLMDRAVYSIPCVLLVGWRGEPGVKDEPQHLKQGEVTLKLLNTLDVPHETLPTKNDQAIEVIKKIVKRAKTEQRVTALIVRKGTFSPFKVENTEENKQLPLREEVLDYFIRQLGERDIVVATTGKTSRELFELREKYNQGHANDFLTVGSMGHASQIALGIASNCQERQVYCFDGDGAFIMHLGGAAIIGERAPKNYKHIVLNNGAHESVGGQPTAGFHLNMLEVAKACGYKRFLRIASIEELQNNYDQISEAEGPVFVEIRVRKGARKDLGRPTIAPIANKEVFMEDLR